MVRMPGSVGRLMLGLALVATGCTFSDATSGSSTMSPSPPASAGSETGAVPLIVDYSPTVSDVGALLYLLSDPGVEVLAITLPATGEAGCELGIDVTLGILEMFGRHDIPVACDSEVPSGAEAWPAEFLAGNEALAAGLPTGGSADPRLAHQLIADVAAATEEPVVIFAVAPLTNIALALERHPELTGHLDSIVIMGGAIDVPGNVESGDAEWNLWIDVPAAASVFESGVPITLVPLDATNDVPVPASWQDSLDGAGANEPTEYLRGLVETFPAVTSGFFYLWDELAASVAVGEDLVVTEQTSVMVVTEAGPGAGSTVRDPGGVPISVATAVPDPDRFYAHFLETLAGSPVELQDEGDSDIGGAGEDVLADWLVAGVAGDVEGAAGLVAGDATWIGPVGASPQVFVEGAAPYKASDVEVTCTSDQGRAVCEATWTDLWIEAIPELDRGWMRVRALVEDGRIVAFDEWIYDEDLVTAFESHFAWLENENPRRLAEACAADSGSKPCSELLIDTVDEWIATIS